MANNQKYSPLYLFYESSYSNPDIVNDYGDNSKNNYY